MHMDDSGYFGVINWFLFIFNLSTITDFFISGILMYVVFCEIKFKSVTPYLVNKLVYMFGLLKISRKSVKI